MELDIFGRRIFLVRIFFFLLACRTPSAAVSSAVSSASASASLSSASFRACGMWFAGLAVVGELARDCGHDSGYIVGDFVVWIPPVPANAFSFDMNVDALFLLGASGSSKEGRRECERPGSRYSVRANGALLRRWLDTGVSRPSPCSLMLPRLLCDSCKGSGSGPRKESWNGMGPVALGVGSELRVFPTVTGFAGGTGPCWVWASCGTAVLSRGDIVDRKGGTGRSSGGRSLAVVAIVSVGTGQVVTGAQWEEALFRIA